MTLLRLLLLLGFLTAAVDDGIAIDPHGGGRTAQADDGNGFDHGLLPSAFEPVFRERSNNGIHFLHR